MRVTSVLMPPPLWAWEASSPRTTFLIFGLREVFSFSAFLKSLIVSPSLLSVCTPSLFNCSWNSALLLSVAFSQKHFLQHPFRGGRGFNLVLCATATPMWAWRPSSYVVAGGAQNRGQGDQRSSSLYDHTVLVPAKAPTLFAQCGSQDKRSSADEDEHYSGNRVATPWVSSSSQLLPPPDERIPTSPNFLLPPGIQSPSVSDADGSLTGLRRVECPLWLRIDDAFSSYREDDRGLVWRMAHSPAMFFKQACHSHFSLAQQLWAGSRVSGSFASPVDRRSPGPRNRDRHGWNSFRDSLRSSDVVPGPDGSKVCFRLQWEPGPVLPFSLQLRALRQQFRINDTQSSRRASLQSVDACSRLVISSPCSDIVFVQRRDTCHQRKFCCHPVNSPYAFLCDCVNELTTQLRYHVEGLCLLPVFPTAGVLILSSPPHCRFFAQHNDHHTSFFDLVFGNSQQSFQRRTAEFLFFAVPDR